MTSIGEALVAQLAERGVKCVFGIPGVHTIELYRGLATSKIRHVTPRHEQGAGFMADGYARVTGKPGAAFVITGPGVTNTLTAMAQARADSVPMLVVSGVNTVPSLGKGLGHLHELPDQRAMVRNVALVSERVERAEDLGPVLDSAFRPFHSGRPGPTHIEIPLDVVGQEGASAHAIADVKIPVPDPDLITQASEMLARAKAPVILTGGGARHASQAIVELAERIGAPVVQTTNARGVAFDHPLGVPVSPSLKAVRELIETADVVLAVGTEFGQTDYDMYATGTQPSMASLIRVDRCAEQLARHPADLAIKGDAVLAMAALVKAQTRPEPADDGEARATRTRGAAFEEIGPEMRSLSGILDAIRDAAPNAIMVGDSAQPIYAGNLYYDHDRPGGWFNAATGFGALGYGIPAAIGAAIGDASARIICITGDGGAQFSLPELMCAVDEKLPITFVVWNNHGYQEIATSMQSVNVEVVGCDPSPPLFEAVAKSCSMPFWKCAPDPELIAAAIKSASGETGPTLIEIEAPNLAHPTHRASS
ncbi:5-guanidino-2-oxopentanoate decarboxylase [Aliiroseovarius sp. PrR006]|uniref:5-guanidino-2-oxopentanoate decarboxylase n=1 Tax=Aliiroseovarius sp. PrR006 TaxID=2706883 RepID=UPI0013D17A5E|nr:5-guanidino-2-oxopentanoate decarboxylase [Aliiroseovarius sp. PrR006]NDW53667.1 5-guanidino-2-oxopentanoate decarboxylase [Aliiroseovarius sp. PrR006]